MGCVCLSSVPQMNGECVCGGGSILGSNGWGVVCYVSIIGSMDRVCVCLS